MSIYFKLTFLLLLLSQLMFAQPAIIPQPATLSVAEGEGFSFNAKTQIVARTEDQRKAITLLTDILNKVGGWKLPSVKSSPTENYVLLEKDRSLAEEHYRLEINHQRIRISASSLAGWTYGLQSIRQLLPPGVEDGSATKSALIVPALTITDGPSYRWRGLMLDVSRHFFPKEYVLATIDRMAMLKLNVLHLHLVDDQGWRIEIKQYPKLTEVGAWRVDQEDLHWNARHDNEPEQKATYGGFYSQEDIREIVAHAAARSISVVPEIEMPAHVMSALAAYPEYSCHEKPIGVPSGGVWPITDIYCPGKESTFEFLENILTEVMDLFPGQYIHVGGDEATRSNWEKCELCHRRMQEEGLEGEEELQSYFIQRIERFLSKNKRTLIGWDEILEGGLAEGATVMSWRGTAGGLKASAMGHDVVMSPGEFAYLDQYQGEPDNEPLAIGGYVPLNKVYSFDPRAGITDPEQANHILGGQGNLWSEYVTTTSHSEYMIFPRLAALAEVLWTPVDDKDWTSFSARIPTFFQRLDALGVNYARSAYAVTPKTEVSTTGNGIGVSLQSEFPNKNIRYTLDGSRPNAQSRLFTTPLVLDTTTTITAATFQEGQLLGTVFRETFDFHLAVGKPVTYRPQYSKQYPGKGDISLVNVLRGTKNFHDGQWQAWLNDDVEIDLDLEEKTTLQSVSIGVMENQGSGIYYPTEIEVLASEDGTNYKKVGMVAREYAPNGHPLLEEFSVRFPARTARYLRVRVKNLGEGPLGGGSWLFIDEITVR